MKIILWLTSTLCFLIACGPRSSDQPKTGLSFDHASSLTLKQREVLKQVGDSFRKGSTAKRITAKKTNDEPSQVYRQDFRIGALNRQTYEKARRAFNRYQSAVYREPLRFVSCGAQSDPAPADARLMGTDYYTRATPEVVQVSRELSTPEDISDFVRTNIESELLFGATRTAAKTLRTRSGSVADKVNLLVALLRSSGVPSYIISGEVYLKESVAKRLFRVSNVSNLLNVSFHFFSDYFLSESAAGSSIYKMINGEIYWVLPHLWARAYHDGSWRNYDPIRLPDVFESMGEGGQLSVSQAPDWAGWFFTPDHEGKYIKPRTYVDHLMRSYSPTRAARPLNLMNGVIEEHRVDNKKDEVLSNQTPCAKDIAFGLEDSGYEYRAAIRVNNIGGSLKTEFEAPLAYFAEAPTYLSHSAGLTADVGDGVAGNVELRVGDQVVRSYSATTLTPYRIVGTLKHPNFWNNDQFQQEFASDYQAGDVFSFNVFGGSIGPSDLSESIDEILKAINTSATNRILMAKLLRTAAVLFQLKQFQIAKDMVRLRSYQQIPLAFTATFTQGGGIATSGQTDKEFGRAPFTGGIDARLPGYVLSSDSSIFSEEGLEQLRIATEEALVAGSEAEATIWEELFGIVGYSANRTLQTGALLKAAYGTPNLISGVQFDDEDLDANSTGTDDDGDNPQIENLLDSGIFKTTVWPGIEQDYGLNGGKFWGLSKEIVNADAAVAGYVVFRKDIFEGGIAGFSIFSLPLLAPQAETKNDVPTNLSADEKIRERETFADEANVGPVEAAINNTFNDLTLLGGGSSTSSQDPLKPKDGLSFQNGPATVGTIPGVASCNPVDFSTGRMWHTMTDFALRGRTPVTMLKFERTYFTLNQYNATSGWVADGDFGRGWVHTYDTRILDGARDTSGTCSGTDCPLLMGPLTTSTANVLWISSEGNPILFSKVGSSSPPVYSAPAGFVGSLVATTTTYELTVKGGIKYTFKRDTSSNYNGRLTSILEPHGEAITLTYDGNGKLDTVSTNLAGSLVLVRDGNGRVYKVSNSKNGLEFGYTYASGRLESSTDFDGYTTHYEYNTLQAGTKAEGLLSAIVDPIGRRLEFEYYQNGKVFREKDHGGAVQIYNYSPYLYQKYTRVTSPNGFTTEYRYDDQFHVNQIVYPDGGRQFQAWNSAGLVESERDPAGFTTTYDYDSRGNRTKVRRPLDTDDREVAYDSTYDIPTTITPLTGSPTTFTVDSATGNITQVSRTLSGSSIFQQVTYDGVGSPNAFTSNQNSYSNITDDDGLTRFSFHIRNPQKMDYDKRGRLKEVHFKNGRVLRYEYDNYDRLTSAEDTHGPDVVNTYDEVGRLRIKRRIGGGVTHEATFEYDDRDRVIASTNFAGERTEFKYDVVGVGCRIRDTPTKIISPEGKVTLYKYDFAGRKVLETLPGGNEISYKYNLRGDLIAVIDAKGQVTQYDYDGNRRLIKTLGQSAISQLSTSGTRIGTGADETQYFYDLADKLVRKEQMLANESHVNGRYVTEYTYNALDQLVQQKIMHKRGSTVVEEFDNITYEYLKILFSDRLVFVGNRYVNLYFIYETQPPYSLISYRVSPTSAGLILGLTETSFRVVPDMNGPMARLEREGATLIKNSYDESGRLIYTYGTHGGYSNTATIGHDAFGRRDSIVLGTGMQGVFTYDNADRFSTLTWTKNSSTFLREILDYNLDGFIEENQKTVGVYNGVFTYGYSTNNEVNAISYSGNESLPSAYVNTTLTHDESGNLVSYRGSTFETFNNFVTKLGTTSYWPDYSGLGRRLGEVRASDTRYFSYFPDGRIRGFKLYNGTTLNQDIEYYYDGLGRRIAKYKAFATTSARVTFTHLGLEDRILTAKIIKNTGSSESLYVDGQGIDDHLLELNDALGYWEHPTDHLGSIITSEAGAGRSVLGLYGEPLGACCTVDSNNVPVVFGFAGRELDSETGYYYYRARYYDPNSARFLTKDPLGPAAGGDVNAYRYVGNNPVNQVDPNGTFTVQVGGAASGFAALMGGSVEAGSYYSYGEKGFDTGTYVQSQVKYGVGMGASAGYAFSVSPLSSGLEDLEGPQYGVGANLPGISFGLTFSESWKPTLSVGPETPTEASIYFIIGGGTLGTSAMSQPTVRQPIGICNGH